MSEPTEKDCGPTGAEYLPIPIVEWDDAYGHPAPYVVPNSPGNTTPALWDGTRWIELSRDCLRPSTPENVEGP